MLEVGRQIDGRYRVLAKLGAGGLAVVYKVELMQLGTHHALKVLQRDGRTIRERLFREGKLQGKLRHPNIAAVTDIVEVDGMPALVMEFVRGASLEDLIQGEQLSLEQIDHLVRGIIAGVGAAHRAGTIHRDLKPGNVLLEIVDGSLTPKITDFGLAKALDEPSQTQAGVMMGTPQYMPPEQIEDASSVDHRADIWSIGVILYELVTGVRPFEHHALPDLLRLILDDIREPVTARNPALPERMVRAIEGCLVQEREARIQDCATLLATWTGEVTGPEVGGFTHSVLARMLERGEGREPTPPPTPRVPPPAVKGPHEVSTAEVPSVPAVAPAPPSRETVAPWAVVGAGAVSVVSVAAVASLVVAALGVGALWWSRRPEAVVVPGTAPAAERPRPPRLLERPRPVPVAAPAEAPAPEGAPAPAPAPVEVPLPAPSPVPAVAPPPVAPSSPPPPRPGRLVVSGSATSVGFVARDGASFSAGEAPAGRYRVWARFPDEPYADMGIEVDLPPGGAVTVDCDARMYKCAAVP